MFVLQFREPKIGKHAFINPGTTLLSKNIDLTQPIVYPKNKREIITE